jgi:hydrogenase nickel incorporation protein HypA/HybF
MHEMSLAEALLAQVRRHTPADHHATLVRVEAGPYQAINPQALAWAWEALTTDTELVGTRLDFTALPFSLTCVSCNRQWTGIDPFEMCPCGGQAVATGSSDLRLVSLEVELLLVTS